MTIQPTESGGAFGLDMQPSGATPNQLDEDTFLKLLVAQLKYQDPLNPAESTEFLSQTAQFTALEKMSNVADQSAAGVILQMAFGASSLVGQSVTYVNVDGDEVTGTVSGVRFEATGPVLTVDGTDLSLNDIVAVHGMPTTPDSTTD